MEVNSSLREKVILVTGGTSGIGEACSRHFTAVGARVVMASNQEERGRALEAELQAQGREARFVFADVASEESVEALVRATVDLHGRIDGVHCNAGVWARGKVTEFDDATWNKVMNVNVKSVFLTQPVDIAHAAAFLLSDQAGYINGTSLVLDGGTLALPPW